jgi:aryl-alcohol dehydrogenase-like predicted oxidoreductase
MEKRSLGPFEVSIVGLGTNNFGWYIEEPQAREVVGAALDAGVTFIDSADYYPPGPMEVRGNSERMIGNALKGRRDEVVLATKWGFDMGTGAERLGSAEYVRAAAEASLQRLQTDRIDLYQHHTPDPKTPIAETVGAIKELYDEGKILAYGTSNHTIEQIEETAAVARELGVPYVSEQGRYSWLERGAEDALIPACERLGLSFIPFYPLASGLLTGKVRRGSPPPDGSRLADRDVSDADVERVERLIAWGEENGASILEIAFGALLARPSVPSVIAGATKPEQVRANAGAGGWVPTPAQLDVLRAV